MAAGIVVVLAVAGIALGVGGNHPSGPRSVPAHRTGNSRTLRATPSPTNPASAGALVYTPVQVAGLADGNIGWAANGVGIYVTTNGGRTWRTVTPPNLLHEDVSERIGALDAVGQNDLWLVLEDVPGLVPYSQSTEGSDRGEGIDRSTDGGRTWTFTALPGCLQACGANLSVSFVNPMDGFASAGPGPSASTMLFSTVDGGASWTPLGARPQLGGSAQIAFTDAQDGWAVSTPNYGDLDPQEASIGTLSRTTDGGASWSPVPGLPSNEQLPTFFGTRNGVILSNPEGIPGQSTSVFVTDDGGATWTARPLPTVPQLANFKPGGLGSRFSAVGPMNWKIDVGSALYSTSDGGHTWTWLVPTPKSGAGTVSSVVFASPSDGFAIALPPGCTGLRPGNLEESCYPTLIVSADGGIHWLPVKP
jgi:photosystem II stability/assembly factor-like uncharacterized protein